MSNSFLKHAVALALLAAVAGPVAAQTSCSCAKEPRTVDANALASLLANKMACASLGGEQWQEWHNGSGLGGGPLVDYKKGPSDPVDPSKTVGSYAVTANNTVRYTYGSNTYEYEVCGPSASAGTYAFCGAPYGGRNISSVVISGSGLQSCAAVTPPELRPIARPTPGLRPTPMPAPLPAPVPPRRN